VYRVERTRKHYLDDGFLLAVRSRSGDSYLYLKGGDNGEIDEIYKISKSYIRDWVAEFTDRTTFSASTLIPELGYVLTKYNEDDSKLEFYTMYWK
jgi:hypothetical protein